MFGHYLPNKNEGATVASKSKFRELNNGSIENYSRICSGVFAVATSRSSLQLLLQLLNCINCINKVEEACSKMIVAQFA